MFNLTISARLLGELRQLLEHGGAPGELPLGVRRAGTAVEFVAPATRAVTARRGAARLRVGLFPEHLRGATHLYWHAYPIGDLPEPQVDLALFARAGCSAAVLHRGCAQPLTEVLVAGAGMERWRPGRLDALDAPVAAAPADGPFSRYVEPLGGVRSLASLQALRVGVVGCSRIGSLFCAALGRVGVGELVLVDGDVLEAHHLDAMDVPGPEWVGARKVDAVAALLRTIAPSARVQAVAQPLEASAALAALAACDVIVTAPDRGQPRLLASLCAVAYGRVHLDLGTGVLRGEAAIDAPAGGAPAPRLEFGADVRLVLPGHCLMCVGGVDLDTRQVVDWRRQRAGSLRSLNGMAASYGLFLLERLIAGDVRDSTWTRLRLDRRGDLRSERPRFAARGGCAVCAESGRGDAVWAGEAMRLA